MKGLAYEKAVAAVQAMMDPNSKVEHDVRLEDGLGQKRQFDVVVRGQVGGHSLVVVVECKDQTRKVGVPAIEAFHAKAQSVGANAMIFVSRSGFTKTAIEKAKACKVAPYSLLKKDDQHNLPISVRWFMESYAWSQVHFSFFCENPGEQLECPDAQDVFYQKHRLLDWWLKFLQTTLGDEKEDVCYELEFSKPREFQICGKTHTLAKILCSATRRKQVLSKSIELKLDGFYDWSEGKAKVPPAATIQTGSFLSDFSDWEPYDGPIPPARGIFDWRLKGFTAIPLSYEKDVIDFGQL
ncbi:MAG: hypothetical protein GVY36_09355 [Verrucomicrobia bacterium]|jgi:hypothetical protein|nr:hypothetical protein [Verrucomicrobiota bacterium]